MNSEHEGSQPERGQTSPAAACPHLDGYDPLQPDQVANPYEWLRQARADSPVFYMPKYDMWCVANHAFAMEIYRDTLTFSNQAAQRPQTPMPDSIKVLIGDQPLCAAGNINFTDPPDHIRLKRVLAPAFMKALAGIERTIQDRADALVEKFIDQHAVDIIANFTWPLPVATIGKLLGVPDEEMTPVRIWAEAHFELTGGGRLSDDRAQHCWRSAVEIDRFAKKLVEKRRQEPRDDFLSQLIILQKQGEDIRDEEIVTAGLSMIRAGTDTSSQTLGQTLLLLLTHPEQLAAVKADSGLLPSAIEEALRLRGPVRGLIRTATKEVRLGEVTIPAGAKIYLHVGSASRDETLFEHADVFDIRRENVKKHLGFGALTRLCIGAPLARPTVRIGLKTLLDRLPDIRLASDFQTLEYTRSMVVPSLKRLLVSF
ncbi:cytochrome P450 [Bradyrhizobium betae]|uniref:Cytochrome P450 n=1 Tax=Bradyrhizobium betae TaxID=244734 RepID=A0A4Q1VRT1_9BRAD|nr:cytochrome P450 [Bradyrhizobium betae]RXT54256.1 hypothetical protein B5V03_02110 [Bradyrhizobium betae]